MTSKNFNRVLTVVVNKLNKCYYNFSKPESMKSSAIMTSVNLVEHKMALVIDDELYLAIEVDGTRMAEVDLESEVKNSNELFIKVDHLVSMIYTGIYNGDYDIQHALETADVEEIEEIVEPTETTHTPTLDFEYRNLMYTDEYKAAHNTTSTQEDERDRTKYLMETHSFPSTPTHEPTCKKVKTSSIYGMFGQYPSTAYKRHSYKEVDKVCGDCSHFNACMQGNQTIAPTCCMFDSLYRARKNPNWHHVSLATLANIDFDMLDETRQSYLTIYRELQETVNNARKCKTIGTFDRCTGRLRSKALKLYCNNEISAEFYHFITLKLSMLNVEYGLYDSSMELATGLHESRRYNKIYCN